MTAAEMLQKQEEEKARILAEFEAMEDGIIELSPEEAKQFDNFSDEIEDFGD